MPQLSTTHIFSIYLWAWLVLYLIMQKTKTVPLNKAPMNMLPKKPQKPTLIMPWT